MKQFFSVLSLMRKELRTSLLRYHVAPLIQQYFYGKMMRLLVIFSVPQPASCGLTDYWFTHSSAVLLRCSSNCFFKNEL